MLVAQPLVAMPVRVRLAGRIAGRVGVPVHRSKVARAGFPAQAK
jgi:hypothetical protein